MSFVRNAWNLACWSKDLRAGEMFKRRLLNESLVFYRKSDGSAVALQDRCPHRFVPLSVLHFACESKFFNTDRL